MRAERLAAAVVLALVLAVAGAGCGGDDEESLRVGVLADCQGTFKGLEDLTMAGAELPLLQRGAALLGARPSEGITAARVAGKRVELVRGCPEGGEYTTVIEEARRLVELEDVDAVVGGTWPGDGIVLREVARRYPDVAFVPGLTGPREVTLRNPPPNLVRVLPDMAQTASGLAAYAYEALGWRTAQIVDNDWEGGWASADAFAAEFCRLGGRITERTTLGFNGAPAPNVRPLPESVDGAALLMAPLFSPLDPIHRLVAGRDPARSVVLGPYLTLSGNLRTALGPVVTGAVGSTLIAPEGLPRMRAYADAFAAAYPGLGRKAAFEENAVAFREAVEAVIGAFERADGRRERLQDELAKSGPGLLSGQVRMDGNRQTVSATTLARLGRDGSLTPIRRAAAVDQSLGGLLAADLEPAKSDATC